MAFALKVAQEHLPQFVQPVVGMRHNVVSSYVDFVDVIKKASAPLF